MNSRHLLPLAFAALLALLTAGCDVHEFPEEPAPPAGTVTATLAIVFENVDMPPYVTLEVAGDSRRSRGDAEHVARYTVNVYDDSDDGRAPSRAVAATSFATDAAENATKRRNLTVDVPPGTYRYVVWQDFSAAADAADHYYSTVDFSEISLLSGPGDDKKYVHQGNTRYRDAFRGEGTFKVDRNGAVFLPGNPLPQHYAEITMRRPMARYVFVTTDLNEFISRYKTTTPDIPASSADAPGRPVPSIDLDDYTIRFRYTGYMPSVYNAHIDKPVDSRTGASYDGSIGPTEGNEAELGSDFVFVNGHETSVAVAVDVIDKKTKGVIASTNPINVPLKRGMLTVVKGKFLTSTAGSSVGVNAEFRDEYNIQI